MKKISNHTPRRIALAYAVAGSGWLLVSDLIFAFTKGGATVETRLAETIGGVLFFALTGTVLHLWLGRFVRGYERAQARLRSRQLRWQYALESTGDGLWDWDLPSDEVFYSPQCMALLGYKIGEFGHTSQEWRSRIHPDDHALVLVIMNKCLQGPDRAREVEHRVRRKDGSWLWVVARGQVVARDAQGQPVRFIGVITDISRRKLAEERMADTLAFNEAVVQSSPIGIVTYRPDGRALMANEAAAKVVGSTVGQMLQQNFREIESLRRFGFLAAAERALATGEPVTHSAPMTTSFGRSLWMETRFTPFRHGGEQHLLVLVTDETERRRQVEELALLHAAVEACPTAWLVTKRDGVVEWVNPAFTALTGYAFSEVVGRPAKMLRPDTQPPEFFAALWDTILRGEIWRGELQNQRKDGTPYREHITIAPVRDAAGEIAHFVAMKLDVTEQRQLELQAARTQRLESIGLLASGIAHDLNNILAPVLLAVQLLRQRYTSIDDTRWLSMMENSARRGADIVKQVLTFARGVDGERAEVQLKYLLQDLRTLVEETFPKNITLEQVYDPATGLITGDVTQLQQVLLNLAVNARDAMPNGGTLTLRTEAVELEGTSAAHPALPAGRYAVLSVADTGTGIPPDVLEHIFEPFYTTKPRDKGTGLGLSTVYGIVRSHGGVVDVRTKVGQGTEFRVWLPAGPAPRAVAAPAPAKRAALEGDGRVVLVADDEETIRFVTQTLLRRYGFEAVTAVDGVDALEKFQAQPRRFAAVVTDIMMPRMNGFQFLREIRRNHPDLPVLVSSGLTGEGTAGEDRAELDRLGVGPVLTKPYTEETFVTALREALEQRPEVVGETRDRR